MFQSYHNDSIYIENHNIDNDSSRYLLGAYHVLGMLHTLIQLILISGYELGVVIISISNLCKEKLKYHYYL